MARGRSHDKINYFLGMIFAGGLIGFQRPWEEVFFFLFGWFFSTMIFSPDTDCMVKKRASLLQFFLYPYTILFRHRGISHSLLLGTVTRILYGFLVFGLVILVLTQMGYIDYSFSSYIHDTWRAIVDFDLSLSYNLWAFFFLIGMFLADFIHILVDHLTTFFKAII